MKRITTILMLLMLVCMGVRAEEVTLTPANGTYVTSSGNYVNSISFSTTPAITITASANNMDKRQTGTYLLWHSGTAGSCTYTISAPSGWFITAYTVTGEANTSAQTLTADAVSHEFAVGTSSSFTVSDLSSQNVSFVQTGANASGLKITSITVTLEVPINVTYNLYESDGETFVSSQIVAQRKNSVITIPASLKNGYLATDYDYATSGTIGTTDCSIKVTRTLKANGNTPSLTEGAYMSVGTAATSMTPATSASDNNHWYLVTQNRISGSSYGDYTPIYNASIYNSVLRSTNSVTNVTLNDAPLSANEKYLVRFIETGESTGLYYMQFADGTYITSNLATAQTVNSAGTFAFYKVTTGTNGTDYTFGWNVGSNSGSRVDNNGAGNGISLWGSGTNDGNSKNNIWTIYPVEFYLPSYLVQYEISDASGVVYTSDEVPASLNDVITTLPAAYQRDYCSYNVTETTVTSSGVTTVPVTVSYNLPFTVSADYSTATWYSAYFRGTDNPAYYITSTSGTSYSTSTTKTLSDAAMWAFTGNPYDGFKIMNKDKGDGYFLGYDATSNGADLYMKSTGNAFQLKPVTGYSSFCFYIENTNTVVHDYNHKLSFWNSNSAFSDEGSGWTIEEESAAYETALQNLYDALQSVYFGEEIGRYTWGGSGTAEEARANINSAGLALEYHATSTYKSLYDALLDIQANITLNTPTAGFYRLKNVATGQYLNAVSGPYGYTQSIRGVYANGNNSSAATVVELRTGADGLYMYNQGYGFGWVVAGGDYSSGSVGYLTSNPDKYVNWFPGTAAGQIAFAICLGNGTGSYAACLKKGIYAADTSDNAVVGSTDETADAAQWVVEPATTVSITLKSDGAGTPTYYATGYWPFDVTISGADAYTLKLDGTGNWLVPTLLTDNKVPANTPVMLKGSSNTATATIRTAGDAFTTSNLYSLDGTNLPKTFALQAGATTEYFMGINDNVVGFYHSSVNNADGYYRLGANKAYLQAQVSQGARGYAVMWDDSETTGINSLAGEQSAKGSSAVYDLQGRKVANPSRGLYIVNGKKVIIK